MPILDQQQPIVDLSIGGLAIGGGSNQALAQTMTAGISGELAEVQLPAACDPGSDLLVQIEGVSGGTPNNAVLASQLVAGTSLSGGGVFNPIDFSKPARIEAGSQFAIVLTSTGSCGIFQGPSGNSYSGGNLFFIALPNPAGVWVCNCDFAGASFDLPFKTLVNPVATDTTPPAIGVPGSITVKAMSPSGTVVTYSVSATDPDDAVASLSCAPASGSTVPIGTTTVICTASDTHENTSTASFTVHVKGAAEQLADLATAVTGVGPGTSLADKVSHAQAYVAANDVADACPTLTAFVNEVKAQSGNTIPAVAAATLIAAAQRIEAVLAC
jgi:hypothetical protein